MTIPARTPVNCSAPYVLDVTEWEPRLVCIRTMVAIATAAIGMSDHQIVVFNGRTASAYATILYCETFENLAKTLSFKQPTETAPIQIMEPQVRSKVLIYLLHK